MVMILCSMYDHITNKFSPPMAFESWDYAYASVRRQTRDMFKANQITLDALKDSTFSMIGTFNTEDASIENASEFDLFVDCCDLVEDMVKE